MKLLKRLNPLRDQKEMQAQELASGIQEVKGLLVKMWRLLEDWKRVKWMTRKKYLKIETQIDWSVAHLIKQAEELEEAIRSWKDENVIEKAPKMVKWSQRLITISRTMSLDDVSTCYFNHCKNYSKCKR